MRPFNGPCSCCFFCCVFLFFCYLLFVVVAHAGRPPVSLRCGLGKRTPLMRASHPWVKEPRAFGYALAQSFCSSCGWASASTAQASSPLPEWSWIDVLSCPIHANRPLQPQVNNSTDHCRLKRRSRTNHQHRFKRCTCDKWQLKGNEQMEESKIHTSS
jgi:hypothetical protein